MRSLDDQSVPIVAYRDQSWFERWQSGEWLRKR
jgi:hypothetical protein